MHVRLILGQPRLRIKTEVPDIHIMMQFTDNFVFDVWEHTERQLLVGMDKSCNSAVF